MKLDIDTATLALIVSIIALILSIIPYRHKIKPQIKVKLLTDNEFYDIALIEIQRQKHGFLFYHAKIIGIEDYRFFAYGTGLYDENYRFPKTPTRTIHLDYWLNPNFSDETPTVHFWFALSKSKQEKRFIRCKFRSICFPYWSSCLIPISTYTHELI
ncbi:hypothetical protein [Kingella negevensis]|uniref:hypothetical protein n=1 Tax=Kingella negevensis TaxID=1522312 RepID=UPI000A26C8E7|nr:hypothetical protein [Kingella negevensis]WII91874.1 hypothetical protein QEO93_04645 [Kingella negevensis]